MKESQGSTGSVELSVIVPFHRDLRQLRRCLAALNTAGEAVDSWAALREIIVVADGSPEDPRGVVDAAGAHVLAIDGPAGPAVARNRGAALATGNVLVFVDSDVVVGEQALARFARLFAADRDLGAAFGSFDERPDDPGFVSQCKNLAHAFVHRRAQGEAQTFWSGLGAARGDVFHRVGGFDERFRRPSVEDIDLGYRIRASGSRIVLDPEIEGQHLKRWSLRTALVSEIRDRGVPWTQLLYRFDGPHNYLNVTVACRLSVIVAYLLVIFLLLALEWPALIAPAATAAIVLWWLDRSFYQFFASRRGLAFVLALFPLRTLHHLCNGISFVVGSIHYSARRWANLTLPGALPLTPWPGRATSAPTKAGRVAADLR